MIIENELIRVSLIRLGASIYDIEIFDGNRFKSVMSTSRNIDDFINDDMNKGRLIGRTAGKLYYEAIKDSPYFKDVTGNIMHGGAFNYSKSLFEVVKETKSAVTLKLLDEGAINGYVGDINVFVTYSVVDMSLVIDISAISNHDTVLNITSHPYFNLSGEKDIRGHKLYVNASRHHSRSETDVIGTYHTVVKGFDDFRNFQLLSETLDKGVLDHVYLSNEDVVQASLVGGYIKLDVTSSYPGIVIYTQNRDSKYRFNHKDSLSNIHAGIAIEPQYIQGLVPVLRKDMPYKHQIKYAFELI